MGGSRFSDANTGLLCVLIYLARFLLVFDLSCEIQRYLMPLLIQSYHARLSINTHQKDLLTRLATSIKSLKETQSETFSVLPMPQSFAENPKYRDCHTLDTIVAVSENNPKEIPPFSVLRCAMEEFAAQSRDPDTETLFRAIEAKLPWLNSENGSQYQVNPTHFFQFCHRSCVSYCQERSLADFINKPALCT